MRVQCGVRCVDQGTGRSDLLPAGHGLETALAGRRILIIVENLPVPSDRRVWLEARTLQACGAEVTVICPTGKGHEAREEVIEGVTIYRHPLPREGSGAAGYLAEYGAALFWQSRLALRAFRRRGFDVIHACNPPDLIFLVALPFRLLGKRFVFDHHDLSPELYEAKFGRRGVFWRLLMLCERLTFGLATVSIATNESYRQIALTRGGMKAADVFTVRSGPDLSRLRPVAPVDGWRNGRRYLVGYVGVMGEQEGIDLLLAAAAHLVAKGRQDIQFVLVGGGPSLPDLRRMASAMGLDGCVTFTGRVPDAALFEVLSTADLCVNPDRVNAMNDKSTMNKILEYMAFSRPIVQFDVTEGRVSAGDASLYARPNDPVDFADRIEELLADPRGRAEMGRIGLERVTGQFAWPLQAGALIAAYRRVFQKRGDCPKG